MSSTTLDTSTLFATEHGAVDWTADERLAFTLGDRDWVFERKEVRALHEALQSLAAQVYRCNCDCRWQVRLEGRETIVLSTDEVLRLHSLLDGVGAMIELYSLLDDVSVGRPTTSDR
ncbi:hypothetical protein BSZ35_17025 [Salinibacter sp. 10B]|uniref:citrate synthase n=1 Tax=Salinibacter sp. 10B TaxID=1923971 RepID=UPI000CF465CA|nr:citrate synthase [Salinibacter sp. 10B]PQJ36079.1 hypothetical protein BSZ35_17025 [Salinibacter sp. 10B]